LNCAIATIKKDAFVILLLDEFETVTIGPQPSEALDEIVFVQSEKIRNGGDFRVAHFDVAWPTAAVRAALALIVDFPVHGRS